MSINITKKLRNQRRNQYINKTFEDFRNELIDYAGLHFSDKIQDFSESSLGGMLLDFAAIVGDSLSFYVDQQFNELNYETATNLQNIKSHLRKAGIKGGNASPSSVYVNFYIEVDVDPASDISNIVPKKTNLPIVKKGTVLSSSSGITFILSEDVDFSINFKKTVSETDDDGIPLRLILEKEGLCTSGQISVESVDFDNDTSNSFLSYRLNNSNIQKVISVVDNDFNEYYEVEFLSQDTVYLKVENSKENFLYPTIAPFRFTLESNYENNTTLIRFGNGAGKTLNDNILINPDTFILPLKDRSYNSSASLDPNFLIKSNSLGVSPAGKTVVITYLHGGGVSHNVPAESIDSIIRPLLVFPNISDSNDDFEEVTQDVSSTLDCINLLESVGGSNALTIDDLKLQIPSMIVSQNRIVSEKDLLSRIYTMPSDYGKVHKLAVLSNQYTNLAKDIFIVCKNNEDFYVHANDALKTNLKNYINEFRVLGDTFNILDSPIYNFSIDLTLRVKQNFIVEDVLDNVIARVIQNMDFESIQINEAINVNDIINVVLNTDGVASIITLPENIVRSKNSNDNFFDDVDEIFIEYSNNTFSPRQDYIDGFIFPHRGGIFELKHLEYDIVARNG